MGISFSYPLSDIELNTRLKKIITKTLSFGGQEVRLALRSISFNGRDSEPLLLKPFGGKKKVTIEGSLSFSGTRLSSRFAPKSSVSNVESKASLESVSVTKDVQAPMADLSVKSSGPDRHNAALKLQKVYKSFRTRRQLADCAVLVEQGWWKLLDFVELKRSSISFFDIEKPETAISRWSRARKRAAKVGKGLSKDSKARKLALQHWLEAIDPRHRYGHNLHLYYLKWLHCQSRQPFFYWLDIGEGKEVSLEKCPRLKLQQQCIKYLGPTERKAYEVVITDGKFIYKHSDQLLDTTVGPEDAKWIFVLSVSKSLYVAQKKKGTFQHSSFLAGGATLSAGRLVVEDGVLKAVWPHSGHYLPTEENFQEFKKFLKEHNVDLSDVKESPSEEEEERGGVKVKKSRSQTDLLQDTNPTDTENFSQDCEAEENSDQSASRLTRGLRSKITKLEIPSRSDVLSIFDPEALGPSFTRKHPKRTEDDSSEEGYETAEDVPLTEEDFVIPKVSFFNKDEEVQEDKEIVSKEKILKRIDSHKRIESYQLAHQLSSKWATGAGPRISCIKDYPSELQFRVLEQANLSPRTRNSSSVSRRNRSASLSPSKLSRVGVSDSSPPTMPQREAQKSRLGSQL